MMNVLFIIIIYHIIFKNIIFVFFGNSEFLINIYNNSYIIIHNIIQLLYLFVSFQQVLSLAINTGT
jgi:hypothetical protein